MAVSENGLQRTPRPHQSRVLAYKNFRFLNATQLAAGDTSVGATLAAELVAAFCSILDANKHGDVARTGFYTANFLNKLIRTAINVTISAAAFRASNA